ncbi:MAG TPA: hypothetical protein VFK05_24120 [Polyangiaceae bacterium]|nr:hypothetical protein [Polyangiaceae bacterium]
MIENAGAKTMMRGIYAVVGAIGLCACSGSIDVGPGAGGAPASNGLGGASASDALGGAPASSDPGGAPADGTSGSASATCTNETPLPEWPSTTGCASSADFPLVGQWHGYIENRAAPWDELVLDIQGANSEGLCGTLTVGSGPPPPPASDGREAYPPSTTVMHAVTRGAIPGYALTLLGGKTDGARVRFGVATAEGFKSWCELQTSYSAGSGCACITAGSIQRSDASNECTVTDNSGVVRNFTCAQVDLCASHLCSCNASGCSAAQSEGYAFDLVVTGDTMQGSNAHFTRSP